MKLVRTINFNMTQEQLDHLETIKNQDWHVKDYLMVVLHNQGILENKLDKLIKK